MSFNSKYTGAQVEALLDAISGGQGIDILDDVMSEMAIDSDKVYWWPLSNSIMPRNVIINAPSSDYATYTLLLGIDANKPESISFTPPAPLSWQGGAVPEWLTNCNYLITVVYTQGRYQASFVEIPTMMQNNGEYINFSVMDWNIKTSSGIQEHAWSSRRNDVLDYMFGNISDNNGYTPPAPDIIGLQEIYKYGTQWEDITDYINENTPFGKKYAGIIAWRGDTVLMDSEGVALLYNTNRFSLISNGQFWLRGGDGWPEDPNEEGVSSWESSTSSWINYKRVAIWAILQEKNTGKEVFVLNTHYNTTNGASFTTPYYSSELVKKQTNKLNGGRPTIFMGDLNCNPDTSPIKILKPNYDLFLDTRDTARLKFGETYSVNGWSADDNSLANFDYIFTKGDGFKVNSLVVGGPRTYSDGWLSDHNALIADIYVKTQ